jgi:hypothetical protein
MSSITVIKPRKQGIVDSGSKSNGSGGSTGYAGYAPAYPAIPAFKYMYKYLGVKK